jgi:hypothetical protein
MPKMRQVCRVVITGLLVVRLSHRGWQMPFPCGRMPFVIVGGSEDLLYLTAMG